MLLVLDTDANTVQIIQLNRDTMTDVPWLDVLGKYGGTEYKQLCLAFNYGDGGASSCKNTWNAVSGLIFNASLISPIRCAEGELIVGTQYYEFYVDKDSLWETVRSTYCE